MVGKVSNRKIKEKIMRKVILVEPKEMESECESENDGRWIMSIHLDVEKS